MVELYILGPADLRDLQGIKQSFLAGPKRLALLVYLLLNKPRGFHRRDSLLPLFWPNQGQKSARNSLSNMLHHIRQHINPKALVNRGTEEVKLRPETFWSDVNAFEENLQNGMPKKALKLYRGDLLKGFHIPDVSPDLDNWLNHERDRFCRLAYNASITLVDKAEDRKDLHAAQRWAKKAASFRPICEKTHSRLIKLLNRTGNKSEAIQLNQDFVNRYRKELEVEPPVELTTLAFESALVDDNYLHPQNAADINSPIQKSIAVLPFENLGKNKNPLFADAIHTDLLFKLSKFPDLKVTSRTSVKIYKDTDKLLPVIAQNLGVKWILNGEIHAYKNIAKINLRLIKAWDDRVVWANTYSIDYKASNVIQLQEDFTTHVSESIATHINENENIVVEQNSTNDLEALCLHAQGRWSLDKRTEEGINQAIKYFYQATDLDQNYMQAWIGIAEAKILSIKYRFKPADSSLIDAEASLGKALILGPNSPETYTILALLNEVKKDGSAAIDQYLKAIASKPKDANAHNWLGWIYLLIGKPEKALKFTKEAVKLNPLSTDALSNLSLSYLVNGDYNKAILESRRIQHLQPERTTGPFLEGVILYHQGQYLEASNKLKELSVRWAGSGPMITLALSYVSMNEKERALEIKNHLSEIHDDFGVALIYAALGNIEESLHLLLNISEWNYWSILSIHHLYQKVLAPLYADERFKIIKQSALSSYGVKN